MIAHTVEFYRRIDGEGYLARFWTIGEKTSMIAVGNSLVEVKGKVEKHYVDVEAEISRQEGLTDARLAALKEAREKAKGKKPKTAMPLSPNN